MAAKVLALELAQYGTRVNSVGWMWGRNTIAAGIPVGEIPPDAEVAEVAVFLASERAWSMTGQTVDVNGGEVLP